MQDVDLSTIKLLLVDDEAHCTKLMEAFSGRPALAAP